MPRRGVVPKADEDRARRNSPPIKSVHLQWDGVVRGPELPDSINWCDHTRQWWDMWRSSPQSMVMTRSDWEVMLQTAVLHNRFWSLSISGKLRGTEAANLASEIRRREAAYGATHEDRLKLRMDIDTPHMETDEVTEAIAQQAQLVVNYAEMLKKG